MLSLPYHFDTAATWVQVVKLFFIIAGVYATAVVGSLLEAQFVAGFGALLFGVALCWTIVRRVRDNISMGARGCLSATDITTQAVSAWGYSLKVPVGRFPISQFSEIAIIDYGMTFRQTSSSPEQSRCSVSLVGDNGTPNIEVLFGSITAANAFAHELGEILKLPLRASARPGLRVVRVNL
ncbi:MAG TPA: hypothetical protein VJN70_05335 [Gemmatimonadaceae bacterium]|nr:hypothetical protein [Gemmatimonadaceae bacterium]